MHAALVHEHGCAIVTAVVPDAVRERLAAAVTMALSGAADGSHGLALPVVRELATSPSVRALVASVLGPAAFAVHATLFDKAPQEHWLVAWHQDLAVPVRQPNDAPGYGPWLLRHGVTFVQPPVGVLQQMLTVRLDLDGSDRRSGALRVLPGTHTLGVLTARQRHELAWTRPEVTCEVPAGGALLLRPLLLHGSSRAESSEHRRVVQLEFAVGDLPGGLEWHERVH